MQAFGFLRFLTIVLCLFGAASAASALDYNDSPFMSERVSTHGLPLVDDRLPDTPLVVDIEAKGREPGTYGGTLRTMVTRNKDVRQMVVYGYARLIGYDENYELKPDLLRDVEVVDNKIFTLHLRPGHKWSNGTPFTSEDFRYWWDDVANNPQLSPAGPPDIMRAEGHLPTVTFPDELTVRIEWTRPHPSFLPTLAQARPPFIYRPSAFLKQFHEDYASEEDLKSAIKKARLRSWAALHNKSDNMYKNDNPELPTLQPWVNVTESRKAVRYIFERNPYYHRVDSRGNQLPYIDVVEMAVVGGGLVAAKANAGEADLQARGLDFRDVSILKKGELDGGNYNVNLWGNGAASQIAIYPNLNFNDPVWQKVIRDVRFRRALSMGIDRRMINRALYFGMAREGGMSVLSRSSLYKTDYLKRWTLYDPASANAFLDDMGLTQRDNRGVRLLPDGRPMEFVIETAGERQEVENALAIVTDTWRELGVKLVMRPLDRDILRNRVFAGVTMASVWFGWDNGVPSPQTPPDYLAPVHQEFLAWPKWGQNRQTDGHAGEPPDTPEGAELLALLDAWYNAPSTTERTEIWHKMLNIHADNQFAIGILNEAPQPVVVSKRLRNVPVDGKWAWDPGAHFGVHRMDEFWFADPDGSNS